MTLRFCFLCVILVLQSCKIFTQNIDLPGKIAVETGVGRNGNSCDVYFEGVKKSTFDLQTNRGFKYSGLRWINGRDFFLCVESKIVGNTIKQSRLVEVDTQGKFVQTIYESKLNELVGSAYIDPGDQLIVFFSWINSEDSEPMARLNPVVSLVFMDFKTKEIIRRLDNFSSKLNIDVEESPWFPDGNRMVYCLSNQYSVKIDETENEPVSQAGVYIYNVKDDRHDLIVRDGVNPICSPVANFIAFTKEGKIWLYDMNNNSTTSIYTFGESRIGNIHWTPDSKFLYFTFSGPEYHPNGRLVFGEKLISVADGTEVSFQKIGHGFETYTWK
jgi:hypothetical protein